MKLNLFALALMAVALPEIACAQSADAGGAMSRPDIEVVINGKPVDFADAAPMKQSGHVLVPLRAILRTLPEVALAWDPTTETVSAAYMDRTVRLRLGSSIAKVNGSTVELDTPATTVDGRTMVPLRFLSEALGADVQWSDADQRVTVAMPVRMPAGSIAANQGAPIIAARQPRQFFRTAQTNRKKLTTRGVKFNVTPQMTDAQLLAAVEQQLQTDYQQWAGDREKWATDNNNYNLWANLQLTFNTMVVYNGSAGFNGMPSSGLVPLNPVGWAQWQSILQLDAAQVMYDVQRFDSDYNAYLQVFRRVKPNDTPVPHPMMG